MGILLIVIAVFALFSLVLAVREAITIVRLSPAATGLKNLFWFGWLRFGTIEGQISAAAKPHLEIYKRTVVAFVVFVVLGLALSWYATGLVGK